MRYKRYPTYKDSGVEWLGEVPSHWNCLKLKRLVEMRSGDAIPGEQINETGLYPVYGGNGIRGYTDFGYIYEGTLPLIGRQGALCGNVNYGSGKFWASEHAVVVSPRTSLSIKWLGELLRSMNLNQYSISAAQPGLSVEMISNLAIPVPPHSEQIAIAAFLDDQTAQIDALIAKQERLIAVLQEKRQALISHVVTKGLNPDAPMKDSGVEWLGEVPSHWEVGVLGHNTKVKARLGWKGLKAEEYVDDGYIFLSTPNIKDTEIDFVNVNYITQERYDESPEIMLAGGDVLVTKDGSVGIANVVRNLPLPATVNSSIAVIRPNQFVVDGVYLYYFFRSHFIQNTIQRMKGGMGVPHLFQADLRKFRILVPPYAEQSAIAALLDCETSQIDSLIKKAEDSITLLKERRSALISAAVTGKIDVRNPMN